MAPLPRPEEEPPAAKLERIKSLRDAGRFLEAIRLAQRYTEQHPEDPEGHSALGLVHLYAGRPRDAGPGLARAVRLAPKDAQHHHNLSLTLEALGRDSEAITGFRTVIALAPDHVEALERLGNLLHSYDYRTESLDCFRRAAEVAPDTIPGRLNRARVLLEEDRYAEAVSLLQESVSAYPDHVETKRTLATILREQGRFDEAVPLLEAATEGTPAQAAAAYFDLAVSKRITQEDEPMLEQMRALLDYRPLSDPARQRVLFGLGKAYDDLGDYAAAMRHFDMGNRLVAGAHPFDRAQFGASVQRVIATTGEEFFAAHRAFGSPSELPVLVLGMPRSGTTLVEQIVSSHPNVGGGDELPFWNRAAMTFAASGEAGVPPERLPQIAAEYESVLTAIAPGARRVTDKRPGNFLWIGLFHLVFPRGRVIHCRRNPLDTCLSNYFTYFGAPMGFAYDKGHLAFYYRTYLRLMEHWREVLPPEVFFEVDYEELVADPEPITRRMIAFLGLPWDDACLRPQDNQRIIRTASQWQARQPTYRTSVERWRRYEPWLGELRQLLDDPPSDGEVHPTTDNAKLPVARRLREADRFDEAIATLQEALRASLNDPVLYNELGTVFLQAGRVTEAVECFERALGLNPNFATAHYNLGAALEGQGRPGEAVAALRRAIALDPELGRAHSRLGNLLEAQGAHDEAMACFRRASELLTSPAEHDLEEAKLLLGEGRPAEAEPRLRNVIALDPRNSLAHSILGDVLSEAGQFDEAVALLRKAIELDPDRVGVWHKLAILRRLGERDRPFVAEMEAMLERPGRSDFDRTMLHFALGKAYDDLGDPERAIRHFDEGNALERRKLTFEREALVEWVDRLIATQTRDFFARHAAVGAASELPIFILGMPRSGTTLVEQILSAHPAVAAGDELTFWSEHRETTEGAAAVRRFADEYLALLEKIGPQAARVTDKNPFNFHWLGLIHLALPRARIVHCRRDPIDTCLSIYFTHFLTPQSFAYDRGDLAFYYRQYTRLMAHWREVVPRDRFIDVDYEALTGDPEGETRRLIAFAGLAWDDACLSPERNERVILTASRWQARQPVYRRSVERWRRYEPWLGELRELAEEEAGRA